MARVLSKTSEPRKPYLGLVPYNEEDAQYFFGRERERGVIMANLMASRLTLLYGASGVGKSSVLRAGVGDGLQRLAQQNLKELGTPEYIGIGFSSWRDNPTSVLINRVRESIRRVFETARAGRFHDDDDDDEDDVDASQKNLSDSLQALAQEADATLLITLDQFEEYFLYRPQHTEKTSFAAEFTRAVNNPNLAANFLISIREDALAKLDSFREDIPNLFDNYLRVDHLDRKSARKAIEEPIKRYNILNKLEPNPYLIEPELVDEVLAQVQTGQVLLANTGQGIIASGSKEGRIETPYLQIVMTRLWDEEVAAKSRTLRLETLKALGDSRKIIETHLDTAMSTLSEEHQRIAAKVFNYLVTPSGTKIAHSAADLAAYSNQKPEEIVSMLEKLSSGDARVLRTVPPPPDQPTADHRYEIFHDVLASPILAWRARFESRERSAEAQQIARKNLERALGELNESELDIAARIFGLLITPEGTRVQYTLESLSDQAKVPVDQVRKVVTKLSTGDIEVLHIVPSDESSDHYEVSTALLVTAISDWAATHAVEAWHQVRAPNQEKVQTANYVGSGGLIVLSVYHLLLAIFSAYTLFVLWPDATRVSGGRVEVHYFFRTFSLSSTAILLIIAPVSGLLGGLFNSMTRMVDDLGNRVLRWRQVGWYFFLPYIGGLFGLIVVLLVRSGFLAPQTPAEAINPFGIASIAGLAGLFASSLVAKVREISATLFKPKPRVENPAK